MKIDNTTAAVGKQMTLEFVGRFYAQVNGENKIIQCAVFGKNWQDIQILNAIFSTFFDKKKILAWSQNLSILYTNLCDSQ